MPPTTARPPSTSLFARIKSPFGPKARSLAEYYIKPDDPHRQYSPGDCITGCVVLRVVKPIRVTHIVVSLHGFVQVYKAPNSPGDGYRAHYASIASGRGSRVGGYFGNGFASLFEDEVVLCGEGRLGEGTYQFNFELVFPSKGLPSSIDFERGTISYMLTSTVTRPTTIMPTTSCDRKVYLLENVDIAPLFRPKPRVVTLERVSRRSKAKSKVKKGVSSSTDHTAALTPTDYSRSSRVSELGSTVDDVEAPGSPAPSDTSFDSHLSSSGAGSSNGSNAKGPDLGTASAGKPALGDKHPITATIELLKAGFLRGDTIPLKISIKHTKHFQNLRGIIVTLYRQARVDMHPAIPVVMNAKGEKVQNEDYYPKSKTGLGGLSLSSAGSTHVYRKDLSQSFAPLVVDPRTRTAEVKAVVRVPDDAFPTITTVPGAMISFKYYVEVVVDLQGKLTGLDKYFSNSGMMLGVPASYSNAPATGRAEEATASVYAAWGGHFLDTEPLRRDKGVVSCVFEVIVGTKDSDRRKGKRKADPGTEFEQTPTEAEIHDAQPSDEDNLTRHIVLYSDHTPQYEAAQRDNQSAYPRPESVDEDSLPEKERLRRTEMRLLPSQPPQGEASSVAALHTPSAPILTEHDAPAQLAYRLHAAPVADDSVAAGPSAPPLSALDDNAGEMRQSHAPCYEEQQSPQATHQGMSSATDDKHELQRRRLEMERSSPQNDPEGDLEAGREQANVSSIALTPTAPIFTEGYVLSAEHSIDLPRYER
ncbi:uncharacterized protein K452DRAFT_250417 [Aplosporella prunicola CBS 121167]|uniref:Arrestin C-terminal-like domain-containing protein n=1 Tax=Aplosporella prunicola CBS 121167 TaxID=1176127 RepID=A0A6A6BEI0_9PEZI|nr:uncharacterized protein K452DRAFT_250417 [Aplosporella prunicola CBS 121167]KAF2141684.1 hypothetical protein K452DRAFT_250417 [Aplosporella prunicola CBS 121167]